MKQKKLLLPVIAAFVALLSSCVPAPSMPPAPDTEKIVEEIKSSFSDNIAENIHEKLSKLSSVVNDTILSVNAAGDTVRATVSKMDKSAPITVTVEGLNVAVKSSVDYNYYDFERARLMTVQVTSVAVIIVLFLLFTIIAVLIFFYRRAKNRNEIIAKAIESNYQLPDSFYNPSSDRGWSVDIKYDNTEKNGSEASDTNASTSSSVPTPPVYRKNRDFEKGWRNVAIGIGVIIIFTAWDAPVVSVLGIIPLLIGAGQLLTYYKIIKK